MAAQKEVRNALLETGGKRTFATTLPTPVMWKTVYTNVLADIKRFLSFLLTVCSKT